VRISAGAPFIPLQLSWEPTPFCVARRSCREDWASFSSYHSRRVLGEVRIKYMTCRAGIGQTPYASFTLQAAPYRTESIRYGKQTYVMKWKRSHCTPNRTGPTLTECVHWLMFVNHKALIKYGPPTLFDGNNYLTRPLVLGSQSSWRGKTRLKLFSVT